MSRFLRRIFSDKHLNFGRDTSPSNNTHENDDNLQESRRVITKNPTSHGRTETTSFRARLSQLNLALHSDEDAGRASIAGSDMRAARPILAPSVASHERLPRKTKAPRRRLSKRHRMPDLRG
jgi:hypothetical protein